MQDLKINILLSALNLTHDDIAEAIGVTRPMVSMTIAGKRTSKQTQERITKFIRDRVTTDALFGQPESKTTSNPKNL